MYLTRFNLLLHLLFLACFVVATSINSSKKPTNNNNNNSNTETTKMAVVSNDHADESYNMEDYNIPSSKCLTSKKDETQRDNILSGIRIFSSEEIESHNRSEQSSPTSSSFWACIDGFVVDASDFLQKHPGGKKKILQTNDPNTGYKRGVPFSFSFSKGRNAHFPDTARIFQDGVKKFLESNGDSDRNEIVFPSEYRNGAGGGKLILLGRLHK